MFGQDRSQIRQFFLDVWARRRRGETLDPLATQIVDAIEAHPEYHALFDAEDAALHGEYLPEQGASNPFLHLGMHLAIREQTATDRPAGMRAAYQALCERLGDSHQAEHAMMDCLGESLWTAQRNGTPPDEQAYLECLKRLAAR
ncbi:DUF1841 family protein [Acidihalobacter ferrooxydans]|uniref:DUF1841 domain-containing protein n=1 Tax=Acidihalobacter ferrooxydans TaxID=1765967 RepID=A0A1P8UDI5_9GAMM|nr:DUF1841 family protein [Acidihalobacter ferrooxydans]APZ41905.1 hypothetical protein BW247_01330 [Acidihalobacter ferrooxydans]